MTVPEYRRWVRRDQLVTRALMAFCFAVSVALLAAMVLLCLSTNAGAAQSSKDAELRAAMAMRAKGGPQAAAWEFAFLPRPPADDVGWVPPDTTEEVGPDGVTTWTFAAYGYVPITDDEGTILGWWWVEPGDRIRRESAHMVHIRWV